MGAINIIPQFSMASFTASAFTGTSGTIAAIAPTIEPFYAPAAETGIAAIWKRKSDLVSSVPEIVREHGDAITLGVMLASGTAQDRYCFVSQSPVQSESYTKTSAGAIFLMSSTDPLAGMTTAYIQTVLAKEGSLRKAGKELGCSHEQVRKRLLKDGVPFCRKPPANSGKQYGNKPLATEAEIKAALERNHDDPVAAGKELGYPLLNNFMRRIANTTAPDLAKYRAQEFAKRPCGHPPRKTIAEIAAALKATGGKVSLATELLGYKSSVVIYNRRRKAIADSSYAAWISMAGLIRRKSNQEICDAMEQTGGDVKVVAKILGYKSKRTITRRLKSARIPEAHYGWKMPS